MPDLNDIPFELFITYLLPEFSVKELGSMSMVDTIWRDMCDDNEVWKHVYMRTIRAFIVDGSVHIGGKRNQCLDNREMMLRRGDDSLKNSRCIRHAKLWYKVDPVTYRYLSNPGVTVNAPLTPPTGNAFWYRTATDLLLYHECLSCQENEDFVRTLMPWREVRGDGLNTDEFPKVNPHMIWSSRDCLPYLLYIRVSVAYWKP